MTWISYFAILLLSTIVIMVMLNRSYQQATISTISSLNAELTNYVEKTSSQIQHMIRYNGYHTFYSPSVVKLRRSKELSNFEVIQGIRDLSALISTSTYVHSVYVYNSAKGYIYTTDEYGSNTLSNFHDISAVEIFTRGISGASFEPIYRPVLHRSGNNTRHVYSFILYESSDSKKYDNALMINIYEDEYNDSFFGSNYENEIILVKDTGQVILHSENKIPASEALSEDIKEQILQSDETNGYIIDHDHKDKYIYLYSYMNEMGRYFIRRMKYSDVMSILSSIKRLSLSIITTIFITGCIISLIMLIRMYLPLKKIIHSLSDNSADDNDEDILKNLDYWVKDRLQDKHEYTALVKQEYLKQLLTSPVSPIDNTNANFRQYEIDLVPDMGTYLILAEKIEPNQAVEALRNEFPSIHAEGISVEGQTLLFVQPDAQTGIYDICTFLLNSGVQICIHSNPIYNFQGLERSYINIKELYSLRLFYPDTRILSEHFLENRNKANIYPDQQEARIILSLRGGKLEEAIAMYREWLNEISQHRYNIIVFAFKRLYLAINSLHQTVASSESKPVMPEDMDFIEEKLRIAGDIEEFNQMFYSLFSDICNKVAQEKADKVKKLITKIKTIIEENYSDPNLSPQTISESLDLSAAYLGKLFRTYEKCSISEYINITRIKHAQELLKNENLTVKEVAQKAGFENLSYFFTLFKNYCNMSPGAYRNAYIKKENN